jgi:hypothetical protein
MNDWSDEETTEPLIADHRNYYKVEQWTKARPRRAHDLRRQQSRQGGQVFTAAARHRPRIRLTIRQRTRVIEQWPPQ